MPNLVRSLLVVLMLGGASAQPVTVMPLELSDILPLLGDLHALEVSLPEGVKSI